MPLPWPIRGSPNQTCLIADREIAHHCCHPRSLCTGDTVLLMYIRDGTGLPAGQPVVLSLVSFRVSSVSSSYIWVRIPRPRHVLNLCPPIKGVPAKGLALETRLEPNSRRARSALLCTSIASAASRALEAHFPCSVNARDLLPEAGLLHQNLSRIRSVRLRYLVLFSVFSFLSLLMRWKRH